MAIYMWRDVITTAWIYHSPDLWLISLSSDWINWITIADKNLGATQVYNDGEELSVNNAWNYYQWWNNYGFPFTWAVTISSTQVNAQNYWPWNYYSSSTFIINNTTYDRSSVSNQNLWWWITWTNEAMKWPCDNGYHVPTQDEWWGLISLLSIIWITTGSWVKEYLKMPFAWIVYGGTSWDKQYLDTYWNYYSSHPAYESWWTNRVRGLQIDASNINNNFAPTRTTALSIRPFKNTTVQPDSSRTVLYPTN